MPRVPVPPKFTFSSLRLRAKVLILSLLCITLTLSAYAGWQLYSSFNQSREQRAYADAMTKADNFSKNAQPLKAAGVIEVYLKNNRPPLEHRYKARATLAYAYIQGGQNDKALAELKRVDDMHMKPESVYILRSLGWYYLTHQDKPKAIAYYKRSITAAEDHYDAEATPYVDQWKSQLKTLEATQ
jgi:tetratricopeptide (TPR) repeat protein